MRAALMLSMIAVPLSAQVKVGVTGGFPFNEFILNNAAGSRIGFARVESAPRRYTLGPFLEFPVSGPVHIEIGALYKRFGFDTVASSGPPVGPILETRSSTTGNSWEFPVLGKVFFRVLPGVNGFVGLGPSVRRLTGIEEAGLRIERTLFPPPEHASVVLYKTDAPAGMDRRTSFGGAFAGGVEFRAGPLRLAPGLRITRWDSERTSRMPAASRIGRTQTEASLSVSYAAASGRERPLPHILCCFEAGILAGVPLTPTSEVQKPAGSGAISVDAPTRRYAFGALVDWRFHPRFSIEASFLVRRFARSQSDTLTTQSISGYFWEAPLLMKWRPVGIGRASLMLGAGPALRRASSVNWVLSSNQASFPPLKIDGTYISRSSPGLAISGGFEFRAGGARLRPELRFTHFGRPLHDLLYARNRASALIVVLGVTRAAGRR